jgi:predicted transcriptional regulator
MKNEVVDPHLTTKIVTSYVRHQTVGGDQVSELITSLHRTLRQLGERVQPASSSKRQAGAIPNCCIFMELAELHETLAIG